MVKLSTISEPKPKQTKPKSSSTLNASVVFSEELRSTLLTVAEQLAAASSQLATHMENEINNPTYIDDTDVVGDRLIEWIADIFAISEDIKFCVNPPVEPKGGKN